MDRLTDPGYIPERVISAMSNEQIADLYKKLCLYESTGIEPEEISAMMAGYTALIEQAGDREAMDPDFEKVFADYIGLYDSIHILQYGGILDEEEVHVCEHNLLFQIIEMMHAEVSRERSESR